MPLTKAKKEEVVKDLTDKLNSSEILVFSNFHGLNVAKVSNLRRELRKEGGDYMVAKKTLARLVLKNAGKDMPVLEGEVAFVFGHDNPLAIAKSLTKFAKANEELKILGGVFEGRVIDAFMVKKLADVPPREVLLAQVVGIMKAPQQRLVGALNGNLQKFVVILKQISVKK